MDVDLDFGAGASPGDILVRNNNNDWVPVNVLPRSFTFVAADWTSGSDSNIIEIPRTGLTGPGQIGPHDFDEKGPYQVIVYEVTGSTLTEVVVSVSTDVSTGLITLRKTGLAPAFDGQVVVASII
jgi:hypothetical protein